MTGATQASPYYPPGKEPGAVEDFNGRMRTYPEILAGLPGQVNDSNGLSGLDAKISTGTTGANASEDACPDLDAPGENAEAGAT